MTSGRVPCHIDTGTLLDQHPDLMAATTTGGRGWLVPGATCVAARPATRVGHAARGSHDEESHRHHTDEGLLCAGRRHGGRVSAATPEHGIPPFRGDDAP